MKAPESGFTLIEVLIAFTVVAVALAAVVRATGLSVVAADRLRDRQTAMAVACDTLVLDRTQTGFLKKEGGVWELGGARWVWTQRLSAGPADALRRVDIEVRREGGDDASARLTGFVRTGS